GRCTYEETRGDVHPETNLALHRPPNPSSGAGAFPSQSTLHRCPGCLPGDRSTGTRPVCRRGRMPPGFPFLDNSSRERFSTVALKPLRAIGEPPAKPEIRLLIQAREELLTRSTGSSSRRAGPQTDQE